MPESGPSTLDGLHRGFRPDDHILAHLERRRAAPPILPSPPNQRPLSASDFYVPSLPGQPKHSTLILYAGHLPFSPPEAAVDPDKDSYGFFFLNKARHIASRPVLMIWLNGGPGCSSFDGSLMEIGPLRMVLKGQGTLKEVEGAWNEYANILFIDQPTGTGYSYGPNGDYVHELDISSANLVNLLTRFFHIFPEYQKMDLYIGGESFAGQYIPYLAQAILDTNLISAPLKGLIIGNGWIDPFSQYLAYSEFTFKVGLLDPNSAAGQKVLDEEKRCNESIKSYGDQHLPIHISACEGILSTITDSTVQTVNSQKMCLNMYDVRLVDTYPACGMTWPPDLADITPYLSRSDVKTALHAEAHQSHWVECNSRVGNNFWAKTSRPSITLFPKLLEKIKILLFSGDQDLICCHIGTERMIDRMSWGGHQGWTSPSSLLEWTVNGTFAGQWREERNLTYALVANASHMAPYDVPHVTQDMLLRFIGVDVMSAAGPAAQVPSRIGAEPETKLRRVGLNETGELGRVRVAALPAASASAGGTTGGDNFYNVSSAAFFLLLVGAGVGLMYVVRRRLRREGTGDFRDEELPITIKDRSAQGVETTRFVAVPTEEDTSLEHEMDELYSDEANSGMMGNKGKAKRSM